MRRWWFSSFIVISFVLLMSCGAVSEQPQKGEDLHSNDLQYYSQEDQKNIFWQNEASFDDTVQKSSADKKWSLAVICGVKYNGEYLGNVYMIMDWVFRQK